MDAGNRIFQKRHGWVDELSPLESYKGGGEDAITQRAQDTGK